MLLFKGWTMPCKALGPHHKGLRAKKPLSHSITSTRYAVHVQRVDVDDPASTATSSGSPWTSSKPRAVHRW